MGRAHWKFADQCDTIYIRAYNIACEHETNIFNVSPCIFQFNNW